ILSISAINGVFSGGGSLLGQAGANGQGGTFALDVSQLPTVASLNQVLNTGSFDWDRSIRVRTGDVTLDGQANVHSFELSTDSGSINVTGTVNASGVTGGSIDLEASGNLVLSAGSLLTVASDQLDAAGKGGAVTLGTTDGRITLASGSTVDL